MRTTGHGTDIRVHRVPAAAALGAGLALAAHHSGGGARPSAVALALVAAVSAAVALLALRSGRAHRGPWVALTVLTLGQVGLEGVLAATDHHVVATALALAAHLAATAAAAVLLLGGARLVDDLREVADRVLPRRWWHRPTRAGRTPGAVPGRRREPRRTVRPATRPAPRGPPLAA
ncbi:hypothetical protein [Actinomycetospora atypica]|uniref:MFS transporter n=1 Tax=Actinomycetospora atypica TaxID=1290095 RepID=A0ABV9YNF6_9PSEU